MKRWYNIELENNRMRQHLNILKKASFLVLMLFLFVSVSAQNYTFQYTSACLEAQQYISVLKLNQAKVILQKEKLAYPNNTAIDYLENYIDFYTLISSQNQELLKKLEPSKATRLERISKCNLSNPYIRYAQAEINLQWAFSQALVSEFVSAAVNFRSAYKLLEANIKAYPNFDLNYKDMGMLKAVLGTTPDNYKWVLGVVGMSGDFKGGIAQLEKYLASAIDKPEQLLDKQSGVYYYILLQLNFGDKTACWNYCEKQTTDFQTNLLSNYLRSFTAVKTGRSERAIHTIMQRPHANEYIAFPFLDYLLGVAKLNGLEEDAPIWLKKYVSNNKEQNLVKDAYMRLSWYYYIYGNMSECDTYRKMALTYGVAVSDEDKRAEKECAARELPDLELLKVRLLQDGGYYAKALSLLQTIQNQRLNTRQQVEYTYRFARIYHETSNKLKAVEYYHETIKGANGIPTYYAPISCLYLGNIFESNGNKDIALKYYEQVLTYKNYEYKSGITQKAKAGISRLSN
jgi:hypothetical protein